MSPTFVFLLFCGYLIALDVNARQIEKPFLRGVTIMSQPFIDSHLMTSEGSTFQGFLVDLMNKISEKVGFDYQLYYSPDGAYGIRFENGTINGMFGEVNQTKADFALADLTITEIRKSYVDFTTPYMIDHLAMLIHKDYSKCMDTFEDVINYNNKQENKSVQIPIGLLRSGSIKAELSETNDTVGKRLYEYAMQDTTNLVESYKEGLQRVRDSRFGMIVTSNAAEFIVTRLCNLTALRENRNLIKPEYGIALPKESKWLEPFNRAILELIDDGSIEKLRKAHWIGTCIR